MTASRRERVLVTGATGRIGRRVIDELVAADVLVRALTRRPAEAALPSSVEVLGGDLTVPESLDAALHGVSSAFLVWTLPLTTARTVIQHARCPRPEARPDRYVLATDVRLAEPLLTSRTDGRGRDHGGEGTAWNAR